MQQARSCDDKRRFHRIVYHANATISNQNQSWPVRIIDLSLNGCLLAAPEEGWSGGKDIPYSLHLGLAESVEIKFEVVLAHHANGQLGFQCVKIDLDSVCQLRRLVELNLGDSRLLERDLAALSQCQNP